MNTSAINFNSDGKRSSALFNTFIESYFRHANEQKNRLGDTLLPIDVNILLDGLFLNLVGDFASQFRSVPPPPLLVNVKEEELPYEMIQSADEFVEDDVPMELFNPMELIPDYEIKEEVDFEAEIMEVQINSDDFNLDNSSNEMLVDLNQMGQGSQAEGTLHQTLKKRVSFYPYVEVRELSQEDEEEPEQSVDYFYYAEELHDSESSIPLAETRYPGNNETTNRWVMPFMIQLFNPFLFQMCLTFCPFGFSYQPFGVASNATFEPEI